MENAVVRIENLAVCVYSLPFLKYLIEHPEKPVYEFQKIVNINEKELVIELYEVDQLLHKYYLQTEDDEDFSGKYFHMRANVYFICIIIN